MYHSIKFNRPSCKFLKRIVLFQVSMVSSNMYVTEWFIKMVVYNSSSLNCLFNKYSFYGSIINANMCVAVDIDVYVGKHIKYET